jgi:hypothetical protein
MRFKAASAEHALGNCFLSKFDLAGYCRLATGIKRKEGKKQEKKSSTRNSKLLLSFIRYCDNQINFYYF